MLTIDKWLEAQHAVLGSVLISCELAPMLLQDLRPTDFTGANRSIYEAISKVFLSDTPVDPVSVTDALGIEYRNHVLQLMEITPTAANYPHYVKICREQAKVTAVQDIGRQLSTTTSSEEMRKLLDKASAAMVDKNALRIVNMSAALRSFMDRHGPVKNANYLSWPVRQLNTRLYVEPGDFVIVGGYPSAGKSAFALQCAKHWAKSYKVGFFSFETTPEKLFDRMMSTMDMMTNGLDMDDIKRNRIKAAQWERIGMRNHEIVNLNLDLIPAAGMTVADIRSVTTMQGYGIILIDYVQLITSNGGTRTEQVTNISLGLHQMAQSMNVTIIGLSQLKRKNNDSDTDAPESSDLRESGQLEQDADVIMTLKLKEKDRPQGERWLYITKNKEGTCPKIGLAFDGSHQTFYKPGDNPAEQVSFDQLPANTPVPFERSNHYGSN